MLFLAVCLRYAQALSCQARTALSVTSQKQRFRTASLSGDEGELASHEEKIFGLLARRSHPHWWNRRASEIRSFVLRDLCRLLRRILWRYCGEPRFRSGRISSSAVAETQTWSLAVSSKSQWVRQANWNPGCSFRETWNFLTARIFSNLNARLQNWNERLRRSF